MLIYLIAAALYTKFAIINQMQHWITNIAEIG